MTNVTINTSGLRRLEADIATRAATLQGVTAGVVLINSAVQRAAPRVSGATAESQGYIAQRGNAGRTISFAVQGSRRRFIRTVRRRGRRTPQSATPSLYEHLIRLGTRPHGGHSGTKANDFRGRALASIGMMAAERALAVTAASVRKSIANASVL